MNLEHGKVNVGNIYQKTIVNMTLDDAIQHCDEVIKDETSNGCLTCANEHKQLKEWLQELKRYKEMKVKYSFELENKDNPNISLYASKSINWNKTEFISKPTIQMVLKEIKRRLNEWRFLSSIEAKYKYEAYSDLYEWVKQL